MLAEAAVRVLPADNPSKPADGRRLLAFSDSRQRAAHFAPYLARTTAQTQYLKPVYEAIRQTARALGGDGAPFDDIAGRFVKNVITQPFVVVRRTNDDDGEESTQIRRSTTLYAADKRDLARECLVALFANFTSSPKVRNNISGLGLAFAEVELNPEQRRELPIRLPDLFKDIDEGWALIQTLLWPMVWRKALVLPDGVSSKQLTPGPEMVTFHYSEQGRIEGRQRWRWNSYLALSGRDNVIRRSQQVQALAGFLGLDAINDRVRIEAVLEAVWVGFRDLDVIRQVRANEFQIPYERLLVRLADQLFACRRCGSLAARSVKRRCLVPNCGGDLDAMGATDLALRFENHHWFHRVTATSPLPLEVREHTAQLTNEAGRQYQRAFMSGDVNVLSSSTTFEMGVDVGQLKSVFLRNVPPSPSNYVQRAGRAGRRKEGAAYAVTYARSIPHDQVHYHDPLAIVQGLVPVPRINLKNTRLTQRHINSFLLGAFLRSTGTPVPVALKTMSTEWFFLGAAPVSGLFRPWLAAAGAALRCAITRIVAATGTLTLEAAFVAAAAGLDRCVAELREKLDSYQAQHAELAAELAQAQGQERVRLARGMESVERLMEQTKQESLIDFLAASHWLPGYAFPQDVVRLLVRDPRLSDRMRLERDVEYGISEYSPGAEVIADGRLLTSRGVDLQNREMEIRYYRSCGRCNRVQEAASRAEITNLCPHCQQTAVGSGSRPSAFIVPRGFTTVLDEPAAEAKIHRVIAPRASEVFLTDGASVFRSHDIVPGVTFGYRPDGGLFRANAGKRTRGFGLCSYCGRSLKQGGAHKKPWGSRCAGTVMTMVHLACRFQTDTLQLRFDGIVPPAPAVDDREFWLSFQNAFVVAAGDVLDIPSRDLGATFRSQSEGSLRGELVVYDRVPGGAGYVGEIVHELRAVLTAAFCRVDKCSNRECDPLGSCYSCLRGYENQFQWQFLRRNRVRDWLANIVGGAVL
ncbi:MAG: helicase-related protein [Polyangiaceae bacterium]